MTEMARGKVYYIDISPTFGSEQGGIRPCVIIQNDFGNTYSGTTIVAPMTTQTKNDYRHMFRFLPKTNPYIRQPSFFLNRFE